MTTTTRNEQVYKELREVIPGGVNSPIRSAQGMGLPPMVAERGEGSVVYDVDGNGYIDLCCSWGALLHGHAHPTIVRETVKRLSMGSSFGITTEIEGKLARKIIQLVPSIEKIRFVSTGSEATMSAARLARGVTGRDVIIKFTGNYHGHGDLFLVQAGSGVGAYIPKASSAGIPADTVKNTISITYNDVEEAERTIREYRDRLAAVIMEPMAGNMGFVPCSQEVMETLRRETEACGALLIFDEVMTGFRVAKGCAQSLYGIRPDLTCFGKIMGGGFPAAAFGGRADIMAHLAPEGTIFQAGTLSGNPVAMEAGLQSLTLLDQPGVYEELERKTNIIAAPVRDVMQRLEFNGCVQQATAMFTPFFGRRSVKNFSEATECDKETYAALYRHLYRNGVFVPPLQLEAWFLSTAHTDEQLEKVRDLIIEFIEESSDKSACS